MREDAGRRRQNKRCRTCRGDHAESPASLRPCPPAPSSSTAHSGDCVEPPTKRRSARDRPSPPRNGTILRRTFPSRPSPPTSAAPDAHPARRPAPVPSPISSSSASSHSNPAEFESAQPSAWPTRLLVLEVQHPCSCLLCVRFLPSLQDLSSFQPSDTRFLTGPVKPRKNVSTCGPHRRCGRRRGCSQR